MASLTQGGLSEPPKGVFAITFKEKRYRNEILRNCQWINNKSVNFYQIEYCFYMRERGQFYGHLN